jgi:hypothetical protein
VAERCCWCDERDGTLDIGGRPFCKTDYPAGKRALYDTRDLDVQIEARRYARESAPVVEQATAAPGEKRATKRR